MPLVDNALIVGGGIAGMSCAIALARAGVRVEIAEIDPQWRVYGAGISITGPTLRAFQGLGVLEDLKLHGFCSRGTRVFTPAGDLIFEAPPPEAEAFGGAGIMRPILHGLLQEHTRAAGVSVSLGVSPTSLKLHDDEVQVAFSNGRLAAFDLVVGADGLFSRTREQILPDSPKPAFTGQGCWRVVAPRPLEVDRIQVYLGGDTKAGLNPVSQTQMYMFLLEHVPDNPKVETADQLPRLRALLEPYGGHIAEVRDGLSETSSILYRPLECVLVPPPWHKGRAVLIGDAAHATTPHLASGAGMAVEDGQVLAEELSRPGVMDVETARGAFTRRRFERCRMVVENSLRLGEIEMARGDPEEHQRISQATIGVLAEAI